MAGLGPVPATLTRKKMVPLSIAPIKIAYGGEVVSEDGKINNTILKLQNMGAQKPSTLDCVFTPEGST